MGAGDDRHHPHPGLTALRRRMSRWQVRLLKMAIILAVGWATDEGERWLTTMHLVDVPALNATVKAVVSEFSPWSMGHNFSSRVRDDHGWRLLSFRAPFNLTVAREELRQRYPVVAKRSGRLIDVGALTGRTPPDEAEYQRALEEYRRAVARLDRYAFPDWVPRFVSTMFGWPDAFMFMVWRMFAGGALSMVIGVVTLVLVLSFLFTRDTGALPGAVMLLPLFTTLIAWLLFLPVLVGASVLNWITIHFFGAPLQAPETVTFSVLASIPAVNWCVAKLTEHHVTEALLKNLDE